MAKAKVRSVNRAAAKRPPSSVNGASAKREVDEAPFSKVPVAGLAHVQVVRGQLLVDFDTKDGSSIDFWLGGEDAVWLIWRLSECLRKYQIS